MEENALNRTKNPNEMSASALIDIMDEAVASYVLFQMV